MNALGSCASSLPIRQNKRSHFASGNMNAAELLRKHGITLTDTKPGRYYTTCPECSKDRKKPGHKSAECLGVTIDGDGVRWGCNHCGWTGPEKGGGGGKTELPSYIYRDRDGVIRFRKVRNPPG